MDNHPPSPAAAPFAPSRPKLRERHLAKRDELLQGALEIVAEEGLASLTIGKLAKKTGSATGSLYRYFPGKSDLVAALQRWALVALGGALKGRLEALQARRDDTQEEVFALAGPLTALLTWRRQAEVAPEFHALLDALMSAPFEVLDADTMRATEAELQVLLARGAELFSAAATAGAIEPGDGALRVRVAWGCLHGLDHMKKRDRVEAKEHHADALAQEALIRLCRGWGAEAECAEKAFALARAICSA